MTGQSEQKRERFAIYARYSSEMQNDLSIEAQLERCRKAIAARGGVIVAEYQDPAYSGWSLERPGFQELRTAAARGRFDAVMFWKFDRLARNHDHAVMIKMLLRKEYDLKLYCVEGYSEDDDNSAYGAMMEQMLAVFSAFYSKNLSSETKRGKQQRAVNGEFNGSIPPIGYDLVILKEATADRPAGLYVNPRQAALVRRAFKLYALGRHSDRDIADWFNERPTIQKLRQGRQPINKETVRDMLQNRVYTGRVRYTDTVYKGSLGERRTSKRGRAEWFEGKHNAIIPDDLFERCLEVRSEAVKVRHAVGKVNTYALGDRVYCARCAERKPADLVDDSYGRMRPGHQVRGNYFFYRCMAHERGYHDCGQPFVHANHLDEQVVAELSRLQLPEDMRERIEQAVANRIENADNLRRMAELEDVVKRIDFSWEKGFIGQDDYLQKRTDLQREMEALRPVDYDTLQEAADILRNFRAYWDACADTDNPAEARKELISKVVQRVYVDNRTLVALVLHGDYSVLLGENETAHANIASAVQMVLAERRSEATSTCNRNGDDGVRTRDLCLDRAIC